MPQGPKILQTRSLARSRCFHIEQMTLRFSNGAEAQYERISSSPRGAVLIIPMLDQYTVLLVREYAGGTQRYELGLPKGRIEQDEQVEEAANREMMEEVGYAGRRFDPLPSMTIAPGYISHVSHPVLVRDLYEKTAIGDEPEPLEVLPWDIRKLNELLLREDFTEARSIAALYIARAYMQNHP